MNYLLLRGNCNKRLQKKKKADEDNLHSITKIAPEIMTPPSHALPVIFCIDHIISQCLPI